MEQMLRPLTKTMITKLQQCREMELGNSQGNLCPQEHFRKCLSGLYLRGFIKLKKYVVNGKDLMGVYLTDRAISFLEHVKPNAFKK